MNQFHDTPITDRATGHTFKHRSYCASPEEAEDLARLTFTNPAAYTVGRGDEEVVQVAKEYSEGWNPNPGWTLQNFDEPQPPQPSIQTELF